MALITVISEHLTVLNMSILIAPREHSSTIIPLLQMENRGTERQSDLHTVTKWPSKELNLYLPSFRLEIRYKFLTE